MIFNNDEEVIELIRKNQSTLTWVTSARKNSDVLKALVFGKEFSELLIHHIEKIESEPRSEARIKYSKDIRDMFARVFQPRNNVFSASGGDVDIDISADKFKEEFIEALAQFKGNKSITAYLEEYFFPLLDTDPNGLIMLEYIKQEDIFPTYKSIHDIRNYRSDGQKLEWLMFEPVKIPVTVESKVQRFKHLWRVVDDAKDYTILQDGTKFTVQEQLTFKHPFGEVPAFVLSGVQVLGTELRVSPVFPVEELGKDYARDKSVLTVYKFLQGFPKEWRYVQQCVSCRGVGKTGEDACTTCDGTGKMGKGDVTDIQELPMPREDQPTITPDVSGFNSPDLETWKQYNEDMLLMEEKIENTIWGTHRVRANDNKEETATGRFIDIQPVENRLNLFSNVVQWADNTLGNWVLRWVVRNPNTEDRYFRSYGRGYIIESPDALLKRYEKGMIEGSNWTVLDKLLSEYILSKYHNNPKVLEEMHKKAIVEPFVHMSVVLVKETFGTMAAVRKQLFGDFWEQANKDKEVDALKTDFETFFNANKSRIEIEQAPESTPTANK